MMRNNLRTELDSIIRFAEEDPDERTRRARNERYKKYKPKPGEKPVDPSVMKKLFEDIREAANKVPDNMKKIKKLSARDQLDSIINFSAANLGNTHPLDQHSGPVAETLFGSDPRPRNQLGMFTDGEEGGPNANTIWQTYKQPAMAGAVGGTAAAGAGMGLRALMDKLKNRKVKLGAREELEAICFARKGGDHKRHWSQKKIGKKQDPKSKKAKKKHYDSMNDMSARDKLDSIISFGYRYEDTEESDMPGLAPTSGAIAGGITGAMIPGIASRQAARDLPAMKANAALRNGKVFTTPGYAATRAQSRYNVMTGGRGMDRIPAAKEAAKGMMTDLGKTRIGSAAKSLNYRAASRLGRIGMLGKLGLAGAGALAGGYIAKSIFDDE